MNTFSKLSISGLAIAALAVVARPTHAEHLVEGFYRDASFSFLSIPADHTYHYYNYYGYAGVGGHSGGKRGAYAQSTLSNPWPHELDCIKNHSTDYTYLINGVCHQGTNRGLYAAPVKWVKDWAGGVRGAGASNYYYCELGHPSWAPAGHACWAPPC